jgi:hypothetical protein
MICTRDHARERGEEGAGGRSRKENCQRRNREGKYRSDGDGSAGLEKGTRFRDGLELGVTHAHGGLVWSQNKLIYDTCRKSGNQKREREKKIDLFVHTPPVAAVKAKRDRQKRR